MLTYRECQILANHMKHYPDRSWLQHANWTLNTFDKLVTSSFCAKLYLQTIINEANDQTPLLTYNDFSNLNQQNNPPKLLQFPSNK